MDSIKLVNGLRVVDVAHNPGPCPSFIAVYSVDGSGVTSRGFKTMEGATKWGASKVRLLVTDLPATRAVLGVYDVTVRGDREVWKLVGTGYFNVHGKFVSLVSYAWVSEPGARREIRTLAD